MGGQSTLELHVIVDTKESYSASVKLRGGLNCKVLRLASKSDFTMPQLDFLHQIDDHGVRWGNTRRIITRSRRPVASRVALDLLYWAMRSAPYRLIRMAIEMASESAAFFSVVDYLSCITVAK